MIFRQARSEDAIHAAVLFREAIHDIAEALTGEVEEANILAVMAEFFRQPRNRLSYENCMICEIDGVVAGLVLAYFGQDAEQLDEPIAARLRVKKNDPSFKLETEADTTDYYVDTVCVDSDFRGKGIGTALLEAARQHAVEIGHERISLAVEQNNERAKQLYKRLGYHVVKEIMINDHQYEYRVKSL